MDRPILFSGQMVRALLEGRKTQTRRVLKPQPRGDARYAGIHFASDEPDSWFFNSPSGAQKVRLVYDEGDRLWVREALVLWPGLAEYEGDGKPVVPSGSESREWIASYSRAKAPSIHMPRWASRLTLLVSDVRVQRLQDISEEDARAEGVELGRDNALSSNNAVAFMALWESINGKRDGCSWHDNPWVVALTFTVIKANIDSLPAGGA